MLRHFLSQHFFVSMAKKNRKLRYSIRLKATTMIVVFTLAFISIAMTYYAIMIKKVNQETYCRVANDISASVATTIDVEDIKYLKDVVDPRVESSPTKPLAEESSPEELDQYYLQFKDIEEDPVFVKTKAFLKNFVATNDDFLDCLYIQYAHYHDDVEYVVYLVDTDESITVCKPGYLDPIHDESRSMIDSPKSQIQAHSQSTNRYGNLLIAGTPIMDGDNVVAYAMADISLDAIHQRETGSIVRLFIYLLLTMVVICGAGVAWVSIWMIRPLKKLTVVANEYNSDNPKDTHEKIQSLNINTHDEFTDLTESFKRMENDVYEKFDELIETNKQLSYSKEETKKMELLANQDGLTGVKNKIAYNSEVIRVNEMIANGETADFAIVMIDLNYLKDTNDTHGHDTGDVALINLATIVCDIFKHSPVYRIGGDEFVVICRGKDYEKVSEYVDKLKKQIAKLSSNANVHDADHISAAVGYSVFDPEKDRVVEDVFKRADKAMYENKREIKQ